MAKTRKRETGDDGEEVVCKYLLKKGYTVVERNYWKPWGEIDIVAKNGSKIRFIEVKSVSRESSAGLISRETYRPEDNMHPAKVRRLHRAIQTYLLDRKIPDDTVWQLDLACVFLDYSTHRARVELLENIVI